MLHRSYRTQNDQPRQAVLFLKKKNQKTSSPGGNGPAGGTAGGPAYTP
jgi:hypothetical protein